MPITPSSASNYTLGASVMAAVIAWGSAGLIVGFSCDIPLPMFVLLAAVAITSTLIAVMVGIGYYQRRAARRDTRGLLAAIAAVEAKVAKVDPMTIYAAVVEDVLTDMNDPMK